MKLRKKEAELLSKMKILYPEMGTATVEKVYLPHREHYYKIKVNEEWRLLTSEVEELNMKVGQLKAEIIAKRHKLKSQQVNFKS
jgi:hypothetical protein